MKHPRRLITAVAVCGALVLSACEPMDNAKQGASAIKGASALQCNDARMQLQAIVDNFMILEGRVPKDQQELIPSYLREANPLVQIDAEGKVVFTPGRGC